jgi:hypothetical protein
MGDIERTPDIATLWAEVMTWLAEHAPVTATARPGTGFTRVMTHEWEDGGATRPDLGRPSIAAMLWDHLEALHGRPSARLLGADPVVTDDGVLDWTFGV